ncbi:MAG: hypothetical protein GQ570_09305 [Helicobacteraceae bacterium]|nr:hypothetical protein [Helicobacteraceae bacterium]
MFTTNEEAIVALLLKEKSTNLNISTETTFKNTPFNNLNFALESASFQKLNILSKKGSYALAHANTRVQSVLRLLS